ncbi:MAG: hypothetical protein K9M10_04340 [Candidatus Pacebacteria bacterium]|nr:hypothetical protein [Candidatus Paceibacterota bacterium]MCF7857672.1 hypothetical protein [Candidatus Paceibacterota bacterium]
MRFIIIIFFFIFFAPASTDAYVPVLVSQKSLIDFDIISDPTLAQTFYGELNNFPHTYEFIVTQSLNFVVDVRVPDLEKSTNNISAIIIKKPVSGGRVKEITRMLAKEAKWTVVRDFKSGDLYREGSHYEAELEPGVYRLEVHSPNNIEKYILKIGTREEMAFGYIETVKNLVAVKQFFNKSRLRIVESPYVYIPLLVIIAGGGALSIWFKRRRNILDQNGIL